ncbi:Oxysterol-binding protein [Decorospora gaudefroyi]|uniref:Oxysterol-binding protein n=1 Tax=Decorospora gaudefroyi TaxID=184978 RepID=A0A6A5KT46_9PLEO|nr:Oxysterol-binding protein [Decorospora gaudefroyi]
MSNEISENRSKLKDFIASIATISGDLSNITAPPFVLATNSTVEVPQYWADHPHLWAAPALEEDAQKRALLVLKNFLGSLRGQQYAGRREEDGVKKPLNAFLGELFLGSWSTQELGETRLVSEQVGHHPPITACYLWNDNVGIRAQGFTEQEITFSGSVSIKQRGYAIVHVDRFEEDYLLPLPDIKVKGLLSAVPHPELHGEYSLISSSGYVSHIKFLAGKSSLLLGSSGPKHAFEASVFHADRPRDTLYSVEGVWNAEFVIRDARTGAEVEAFDVRTVPQQRLSVSDIGDQDPWESRRAWSEVVDALRQGDMKGVTRAKSVVENGQREMRKEEEAQGRQFEPVFFKRVESDAVFERLVTHDTGGFSVDRQAGFWKVDLDALAKASKPFHGDLLPTNQRAGGGAQTRERSEPTVSHGTPEEESAQNGTPVRQDDSAAYEPRTNPARKEGIAPVEQPTNEGEPTDAQVENFLRAKTGNVRSGST